MPPRCPPFVLAMIAVAAACGSVEAGDDDIPGDVAAEEVAADDSAGDAADLPPDGGPDPDVGPDAFPEADTAPDAPADLPDDAVRVCGPFPGGECAEGEVCDVRSCSEEASGVCVARPEGCPAVEDPVCGCDGATYANDCERLRAGAALDHAGACGSGTLCGGIAGFRCPPGEVCDIHGCWPDASGTCVPSPGVCDTRFDPVCGCDGATYGNDCERLAAGAALDHEGACEPAPVCVPECRTTSRGAAWVDPCTERVFCEADCIECTAECRAVGSYSEGWYASCGHGTTGGGCLATGLTNLIEWTDCSP